ncbi:MAG: hypothetical protein J2P22_10430 [Nocardioides sp.]|nr:hypothetical protein [Nocardioides sp.]
MADRDDVEKAEAGSEAREAREAIVRRPGSASVQAIGDALRRYLAAEQYRRRRVGTEEDVGHESR